LQETLYGGASAELLAVLQLQVELLRRSRKYAEAEGVVTRALGICGAAYGPNDVQVAVWKNQLAQVCGCVVFGKAAAVSAHAQNALQTTWFQSATRVACSSCFCQCFRSLTLKYV
jgi:hypothetical protein